MKPETTKKKKKQSCGCGGHWEGHVWHGTICAKHTKELGENYCKAHLRPSWMKAYRLQQREEIHYEV